MSDAVDTSTPAVNRLADRVMPSDTEPVLRALAAERDALAADLRRATEAARAADERCQRYDRMVEQRDAEVRILLNVAKIAYTFSFPDDSNDHLTDELFEDLCGALDALPPGMLEGER